MVSEKITKMKLLLAFEISDLYVKSNATASTISAVTEVPLSTVKRSLTAIKNRKNDYLRLLPELGNEEELDKFQQKIDEEIQANIKSNKWNKNPIDVEQFKSKVDKIRDLYNESNLTVTEEGKSRIVNLRCNGLSMRKIAEETGYSLDTIHKVTKFAEQIEEQGKKK